MVRINSYIFRHLGAFFKETTKAKALKATTPIQVLMAVVDIVS
jgi:hypothetical protein